MIKITQFKSVLSDEISSEAKGYLYTVQCLINNSIFLNGFGIYSKNNKMRIALPTWTLPSKGKEKSKEIPFFFPVGKDFEEAVLKAFVKEDKEKVKKVLAYIKKIQRKKGKLTEKEKAIISNKKIIKIFKTHCSNRKLQRTNYSIKENNIINS